MKITVGQLVGIIVVLIVVAVGAYFATTKVKGNKDTRQAVFLTNGQVYFGYVTGGLNSKVVTIKDIYYLQVQQAIQPAKDNEQPQVSLVKLGNELHGPKDEMQINRDQVLFIEDMKDDSKVNQAIDQFIKNGSSSATPTPAANQ